MKIAIVVLIVLLNAADWWTTVKILSLGGMELNPVMKWIIERNLFLPAKVFLVALIIAALLLIQSGYPMLSLVMGWLITAGYAIVVASNLRVLKKLAGWWS